MAWTYDDYITETDLSAKRTRLALHIREVSAKITADIAADGKSRSSVVLKDYLDGLKTELKELDGLLGNNLADPPAQVSYGDLRGMRS